MLMLLLLFGICSAYNITVSNKTESELDVRWYHFPSHLGTTMGWNLEHPLYLQIPIDPESTSAVILYDTSSGPQHITDPRTTSTNSHIILKMSWWGAELSVGLGFRYTNEKSKSQFKKSRVVSDAGSSVKSNDNDRVEIILGEIGIISGKNDITQITNSATSNYAELIRVTWNGVTKLRKQFVDVTERQLKQWTDDERRNVGMKLIQPQFQAQPNPKPTNTYIITISSGSMENQNDMTIRLDHYSFEDAERVYKYLLKRIIDQ